MNGEAVKEIAALAKAGRNVHVVEVHGKKFLMIPTADGGWSKGDLGGPGGLPTTLGINTLTGFVTYVNEVAENRDGREPGELVIQVQSPERVNLATGNDTEFQHRLLIACASFESLLGPGTMEYGKYMELERFNIALQAVFEDTEDRTKLLQILGTVREEDVRTSNDDGVSQTVIASAGVVANTRAVVPNPTTLRPYRTFREVEQPASLFVVRVKKSDEGGLPRVALFEADGGKWKLEAIENIRQYLADKITGIPILA